MKTTWNRVVLAGLGLAVGVLGCSQQTDVEKTAQVFDLVSDFAARTAFVGEIDLSTSPAEGGFKETFVIDPGFRVRVLGRIDAVKGRPSVTTQPAATAIIAKERP